MDVYRPKKDPRPSRRKDRDNPYEIFSVGINTDNPHFYVSFKDGQGVQICMEIDKAVFDLLDRFELDDLSFLNERDGHIEHCFSILLWFASKRGFGVEMECD